MSTRTAIRGGLVSTASDEIHADVLMEDGRIAALAAGTRAAAWGGTTTVVDFAGQSVGHSLREGLDTWHAKAEGNCAVDYGFHMSVSDVNAGTLKEMDLLVQEGVTSFKSFIRPRDQGFSSGVSRVPCEMAA